MDDHNTGSANVDYTNRVNAQAASHFDWGSIQWLCSQEHHADGNLTFGFVQIEPGHKNPRHYHPNSSEVLYLIEGELHHTLDDQLFHLTPGMSIFIPQGTAHDAMNRGDVTARMVVAYPTGDRQIIMLESGNDR